MINRVGYSKTKYSFKKLFKLFMRGGVKSCTSQNVCQTKCSIRKLCCCLQSF